jgi:hypothetical protein
MRPADRRRRTQAMNTTSIRGHLALLALIASTGAAVAATLPDSIRKLAGSSDDSARAVMAQNGYAERNEKSSWGRKYTFWWSDRARECVRLTSIFGQVSQVDIKGASDCTVNNTGGGGALIDPAQLVGLPRKAADARLSSAGFSALMNDERPEATYVVWFNGRQCLGGNIVADRYEMLEAMPLNKCKP